MGNEEVEEFSWDDDEDVIVRSVRAIAVYRSGQNDIVIRQEQPVYGDDDPFIVVPQDQIPALIEALNKQLA